MNHLLITKKSLFELLFFGACGCTKHQKVWGNSFLFGPTHVRWLYVLRAERLDHLVPGSVIFCDPLEAGGKVTILRRGVVEIHGPHGNMVSS